MKKVLYIGTWEDQDGYTHEETHLVEMPTTVSWFDGLSCLPKEFVRRITSDIIAYDLSHIQCTRLPSDSSRNTP